MLPAPNSHHSCRLQFYILCVARFGIHSCMCMHGSLSLSLHLSFSDAVLVSQGADAALGGSVLAAPLSTPALQISNSLLLGQTADTSPPAQAPGNFGLGLGLGLGAGGGFGLANATPTSGLSAAPQAFPAASGLGMGDGALGNAFGMPQQQLPFQQQPQHQQAFQMPMMQQSQLQQQQQFQQHMQHLQLQQQQLFPQQQPQLGFPGFPPSQNASGPGLGLGGQPSFGLGMNNNMQMPMQMPLQMGPGGMMHGGAGGAPQPNFGSMPPNFPGMTPLMQQQPQQQPVRILRSPGKMSCKFSTVYSCLSFVLFSIFRMECTCRRRSDIRLRSGLLDRRRFLPSLSSSNKCSNRSNNRPRPFKLSRSLIMPCPQTRRRTSAACLPRSAGRTCCLLEVAAWARCPGPWVRWVRWAAVPLRCSAPGRASARRRHRRLRTTRCCNCMNCSNATPRNSVGYVDSHARLCM